MSFFIFAIFGGCEIRQNFKIGNKRSDQYIPNARTRSTDYENLEARDFFTSPVELIVMAFVDENDVADRLSKIIVAKMVSLYHKRLKLVIGERLVRRYNLRPLIIKILKELGYDCVINRNRIAESVHDKIKDGSFFIANGKIVTDSGRVDD